MKEQTFVKFIPDVIPESVDPTPWMTESSKNIKNPILRFHNQTIDFVDYVSPKNKEHSTKQKIVKQLEKQLKNNWNIVSSQQENSKLNQFELINPLFENKFYLSGSELEVFILLPEIKEEEIIQVIDKIQQKQGFKLYTMSTQKKIDEFKVVLEHKQFSIMVWISFLTYAWKPFLQNAKQAIASIHELKYLFIVNMCLIRQRGLHHSIRSLFIFGLCNFFMFQRRRQRTRTLTENFIKFLEYFGIGATHQRKITYKDKNSFQCISNAEQKGFKLYIDSKIDIATPKVKEYFKVIQNRYRIIGNFYYAPKISILAHLINPCLGKFYY